METMFAIIETGGKQYRVSPGQKLIIEKLGAGPASNVSFGNILLLAKDNGEVLVDTPYVKDASVKASVVREGRSPKKIVFRYHSKTRYRKKNTHRQDFTEIEITEVK